MVAARTQSARSGFNGEDLILMGFSERLASVRRIQPGDRAANAAKYLESRSVASAPLYY
jgi:hypothetical protein